MPNHNALVVKHNDLIPALAKMELQELRLLAFCLSHLDSREDTHFREVETSVAEMAGLFNMTHHDTYRVVRRAVISINQKPAEYEEDGDLVLAFWFSSMRYRPGSGTFAFAMNEQLKPKLLGLRENFTRYRLRDVYQFKSASTWRLYEILRQWKEAGRAEWNLDEFRALVGVAGLYPRFNNLNARVIAPALAEINAVSDIKAEFEKVREGRQVAGLRFFIVPNDKTKTRREKIRETLDGLDKGQCFAPALAKILREDYRLNPKQARQLANLAAGEKESLVRDKLPRIKARWEKGGGKGSLGGYVFKSLKAELTQGSLP